MGLISFKSVLLVLSMAVGLNLVISGPRRLVNYGKAILDIEKTDLILTPLKCALTSCISSSAKCLVDTKCKQTLDCIQDCTVEESAEKIAACAYICEMTYGYENLPFLESIQCLIDNKCLPDYPRDGICKGGDDDGVKHLKSMDQIKGDWWVIRGVNCGYGDYPGGYDWYPCQHERFIREENGQWINNVTYCNGKHDKCTSEIIVTIANVSLPFPGVVRHDYTDAPLSPQVESWRIVSWPNEGDYLFMLWCGRLPILEYNGGIVLSRHRNDKLMPPQTLMEFKKVAAKFGLNYDDMCPSNNDHCPI